VNGATPTPLMRPSEQPTVAVAMPVDFVEGFQLHDTRPCASAVYVVARDVLLECEPEGWSTETVDCATAEV
jgi:hypothetical protein